MLNESTSDKMQVDDVLKSLQAKVPSSKVSVPNSTASKSSSPPADKAPSSLDHSSEASASAQSFSAVTSIPFPPVTSDETGAQVSGEQPFIDLDRSSRLNNLSPSPIVSKVNESEPASLLNSTVTAPLLTNPGTITQVDKTSNAPVAEHVKLIAQLYEWKERLKDEIESAPHQEAHTNYHTADLCWTAMSVASEFPARSSQSMDYFKDTFWSKDGGQVDLERCEAFEEKIYSFCSEMVQGRFICFDKPLFLSILEFAGNRCVLSGKEGMYPINPPKQSYVRGSYEPLRTVSLVPQMMPQDQSIFWNFASDLIGDESLKRYGEANQPPYQANEFLVLQSPVAIEFNKFKIAIGNEVVSTEKGRFRRVERNLHEDIYAPSDDILNPNHPDSLPTLIEESQVSGYNQSLLNLHLFFHRLFNRSYLGPKWLQTENWNDGRIVPTLDKFGNNILEILEAKWDQEDIEMEAYKRKVEDFHGYDRGDTFGYKQKMAKIKADYIQACADAGIEPRTRVYKKAEVIVWPTMIPDNTPRTMRDVFDGEPDSREMRNIDPNLSTE